MSTKKEGGHAFPTFYADPSVGSGYAGMTLRDYFAATASHAILSYDATLSYSDVARHAYICADAMIAQKQMIDANDSNDIELVKKLKKRKFKP